MKTITTTDELAAFCQAARQHPYVTLDTEFLRERTYFSKLCLVQMAMPGEGDDTAALIDPLDGKLSLDPLYDLFRDTGVVKVFHAARQDLEICWFDGEVFPTPLFDTQVAAMVCGFGEQVGDRCGDHIPRAAAAVVAMAAGRGIGAAVARRRQRGAGVLDHRVRRRCALVARSVVDAVDRRRPVR